MTKQSQESSRRPTAVQTESATKSSTAEPSVFNADARKSKKPEKPWRLQVVEAWFERARAAGLKTAEERRLARNKTK